METPASFEARTAPLSYPTVYRLFRNELAWLGITHSPSFISEPQCKGVSFETLDEARRIIDALESFAGVRHA